jgi:hypothetical protein
MSNIQTKQEMTDEETLHSFFMKDAKRLETLEKTIGFLIKGAFVSAVAIILLFSGTLIVQSYNLKSVFVSAEQRIENNRVSLLSGLYTVRATAEDMLSTREVRINNFMIKGKRVILEHHPNTDLTDHQMNLLLRRNFELAEEYQISPWIFMAFAATESDFTNSAESVSGARGIVQFMPSTMAIVLGNRYSPGAENNPVMAVEAWYKYIAYLSNAVDGDLKWTAASYMTPTAIAWKNEGRTLEEFMRWVVSWSQNQVRYPWNIEELVLYYNNL